LKRQIIPFMLSTYDHGLGRDEEKHVVARKRGPFMMNAPKCVERVEEKKGGRKEGRTNI